ncbi:MAG: hypothetical protein HC831_11785 [Chloroflexia bacterium]|nr:hypothetical protein [Chloroflexia bacterium]
MKRKMKKTWEEFTKGLKSGNVRSLFFLSMASAIPMFLISILGSIFFGIELDPNNPWVWIPLIPSGIGMLYIAIISILGFGKWFIWIFKKNSK